MLCTNNSKCWYISPSYNDNGNNGVNTISYMQKLTQLSKTALNLEFIPNYRKRITNKVLGALKS